MLLKAPRIPITHISAYETGTMNPYASKRTRLAAILKKTQPHPPMITQPKPFAETPIG